MTEVVRCVRTEKVLPLLEANSIVNNVFVMECAHTLRDLPRDDSDVEQLRADFRDSLSRSGQIIFDVHVKTDDAFLASFSGFNHLSEPKN